MRVGVDEAGKGPVLGSLFAAAVAVPDPEVVPDGVDDSKKLPPAQRESLAARLRERSNVAVGVVSVATDRIDDPETDMNRLTVAAQADAVAAALGSVDAGSADVVADAGEPSERRFARRLAAAIPAPVDVTAEHGADGRHAVVGAASIVAKAERDAHVEALAEEHAPLVAEHGPLGSGYPSDDLTRDFLASYVESEGDVPPFARRSWATCERLLAAQEQSGLGEF